MYKNIVLDIETNNLLANMLSYKQMPYVLKDDSKLHVVVITCLETLKPIAFIPKEYLGIHIPEYRDITNTVTNSDGTVTKITNSILDQDAVYYNSLTKVELSREMFQRFFKKFQPEKIILHNGIKFDLPALQLFKMLDYQIGYPISETSTFKTETTIFDQQIDIVDTLLLSKILNPDRIFGHSLAAWGKQLLEYKDDFHDFDTFSYKMVTYCVQDTIVTCKIYEQLLKEVGDWPWTKPYKMELKLADITLKQELFGFEYDVEKAKKCLEEFDKILQDIESKVNPILPLKKLNKGSQAEYTLPKRQFKANGDISSFMQKFIDKNGGYIENDCYIYEGNSFKLPYEGCVKEYEPATIKDLDHLKAYLISIGWDPYEWKERDVTKDAKKQKLTPTKVVETIDRYVESTLNGVFKDARLKILGLRPENLKYELYARYRKAPNKPLRVPTGPCLRVGTNKTLCPNLEILGKDAEFVKLVTDYLTYRHRRNSIAGGDEDESGEPLSGYLSMVREDGRVPTPADTIGASTNRYRHQGICNIPRVTSIAGYEMRSQFKAGKGYIQIAYDFASLEARVQGYHCLDYTNGVELAKMLLAEKPNSVHCINARKLGITRDAAKSFTYAVLYGAQVTKIMKMLSISKERAEELFKAFWEAMPALKELKDVVEEYWENTERQYIQACDGRKLNARSQHSLLNLLFQGDGAIMAKWSTVFICQELEQQNLLGNPLEHTKDDPKIYQMIMYHDECQYAAPKNLCKVKIFNTEQEAKDFAAITPLCSEVGHLEDGRYYVGLDNPLSQTIRKGVNRAVTHNNFKVELGIAWNVGSNWGQCH